FNWCLEGLDRVKRNGRFSELDSGKEVVTQLARSGSNVKAFVEDCCKLGDYRQTTKQGVYEAYRNWCTKHGSMPMADNTFSNALFSAFPGLRTARSGPAAPRCYRGLKLREDVTTGESPEGFAPERQSELGGGDVVPF